MTRPDPTRPSPRMHCWALPLCVSRDSQAPCSLQEEHLPLALPMADAGDVTALSRVASTGGLLLRRTVPPVFTEPLTVARCRAAPCVWIEDRINRMCVHMGVLLFDHEDWHSGTFSRSGRLTDVVLSKRSLQIPGVASSVISFKTSTHNPFVSALVTKAPPRV